MPELPSKRNEPTWFRSFWFTFLFLISPFLFLGCSKFENEFNRPNLIRVSKDGRSIILFDTRLNRILIADRDFKLKDIILNSDFNTVWGMSLTHNDQIALSNYRYLKITFDEDERIANSVSEIFFLNFNGTISARHSWIGETGPLKVPGQTIIFENGDLLVADFKQNMIVRLNQKGEKIGTFGSFGHGPGELYLPNDICVDQNGNFVVADSYNCRLAIFGPKGDFIKNVGGKGHDEGQLMFPQNLCVDHEGNIYCTEISTMRISVFNKDYSFKRVINSKAWNLKENLVQLFGISHATDPWELYVVDSLNSKVYVIDQEGKLTKNIGSFRK